MMARTSGLRHKNQLSADFRLKKNKTQSLKDIVLCSWGSLRLKSETKVHLVKAMVFSSSHVWM